MAGIKKNTKANKTNKNVKTAKNTSSRERAHKEEQKKPSSKKSTSSNKKTNDKKHDIGSVGRIMLPTAKESSKFINNGIKKRQNEAQQQAAKDAAAYIKRHGAAVGDRGGIKQDYQKRQQEYSGRVTSLNDLAEKSKLLGQSFLRGVGPDTLNSTIEGSHYLNALYRAGGGDEVGSGNIHKRVIAANQRSNEVNNVGDPLADYQRKHQEGAAELKKKTDAEGITKAANFVKGLGQSSVIMPTFAIPGLGEAAIMLQTAGQRYDEAITEGASEKDAIMSATLDAIPTALIERFGGGEKIASELFKGIAPKKILYNIVRGAVTEGIEEGAQQVVSSGTKSVYRDIPFYSNDPEEEAWINPSMIGSSALMGALAGGIMGGGVAGVSSIVNTAIDKLSPQTLQATQNIPESTVGKIVKEVVKSGKPISDDQLVKLTALHLRTQTATDAEANAMLAEIENTVGIRAYAHEVFGVPIQVRESTVRTQETTPGGIDIRNNFNAQNTAESTGRKFNASESDIKVATEVERATGTKVVFDDRLSVSTNASVNGGMVNGYYQNGVIYVNPESANATHAIIGHELTHSLEGTAEYDGLLSFYSEYMGKDINVLRKNITRRYADYGVVLNEKAADGELLAEFMETKVFTSDKAIHDIVVKDRTLAQKILDAIRKLIAKIKGNKEKAFLLELEGRFKKALTEKTSETKGTKYSLSKADEEYLSAVESGDMETAQQMVDEAARKAGYTVKAHHGTEADFTVFDKNRVGKGTDQFGAGFYFAEDHEAAQAYGKKIYDVYLSINNPIKIGRSMDGGGLYDVQITKQQAYKIIKYLPNLMDKEESPLGDWFEEYWNIGPKDWMVKSLAENYQTVGLLDGDLFRNFPNELHSALKDIVGWDGIEVAFDNTDKKFYVAWFDNQMKKSAPVTYDDNGNVIPLSERFNAKNEDIRYSISENERNIFEEELDGISAEGIFENYFKGKDGNIKYGGKKATDEVITAMRFASELTAGIENHFSVIDNKRKISNMIKNVAMNIYLGKGFTENDVIKITKAAYENSGENIEIEDSIKAAKKELRNLKIYIPKDVRGEVNDLGGIVALNKKGISNKTSFTFTKGNDSISLDDMRDILLNSYPDVFSDSLGVEEILQVISITPKKKMKIQGDEEALREGMTEQEMKEILENEISFVRKSLQYYSENVKNRIVNAPNKEVERRYKKESKQKQREIVKQMQEKSDQRIKKERERVTKNAKKKKTNAEYKKELKQRKEDIVKNAKKTNTDGEPIFFGQAQYTPPYADVLMAEEKGISANFFEQIFDKLVAINNEKGTGKKKKIVAFIDSLDLNKEQKEFLYTDVLGGGINSIPKFKDSGDIKAPKNGKKANNRYLQEAISIIEKRYQRFSGRKEVIKEMDEIIRSIYNGETFDSKQLDGALSVIKENISTDLREKDVSNPVNLEKIFLLSTIKRYSDSVLIHKTERERARILAKKPEKEKQRILKSKQLYRSTKEVSLDIGEGVERYGKLVDNPLVYSRFDDAKKIIGIAHENIYGYRQSDLFGNKVGDSLEQIFNPIFKKNKKVKRGNMEYAYIPDSAKNYYINDFYAYMYEKHNIERMAYDKTVTGSTIEESEAICEQLLNNYPEFRGYAEKIYKFTRNELQRRVDSGEISQNFADFLNKRYPHYVPTWRVTKNNKGSLSYQATGSVKDILPLWDQLVTLGTRSVEVAKRNQFAVEIATSYIENPERAKDYIFSLTPEVKEEITPERYLENFGIAEDVSIEAEEEGKQERAVAKAEKNIPVYINGVKYRIKTRDAGLQYAWDQLPKRLSNALGLKALRLANNMKRGVLTEYNIIFTATNGIKDFADMFLYNQHAQKLPYYYLKAWYAVANNKMYKVRNRNPRKKHIEESDIAELWQQYISLGASSASFIDYDAHLKGRFGVGNKAFDNTLGRISQMNFIVEQMPRFAVFMETRSRLLKGNTKGKNDYTEVEIDNIAMHAAANATVNFHRYGSWTRQLNAHGATFLNAGVQGTDRVLKTFRQVKGRNAKETALNAIGLAVKMTLLGITPIIAQEFLYGDDDEYDAFSDYTKLQNVIFKIGDTWVKIPRGRFFAAVSSLYYTPEHFANGEMNISDALEFEKDILGDNIAPANPLTSNILSPLMEARNNKNWYGADIVPFPLSKEEDYLQYDRDTTWFTRNLAAFLYEKTNGIINFSPMKMDYIMEQSSGFLGKLVMPILRENTPRDAMSGILDYVVDKFTIDPDTLSNSFNDKRKTTYDALIENGADNWDAYITIKSFWDCDNDAEMRQVIIDSPLTEEQKEMLYLGTIVDSDDVESTQARMDAVMDSGATFDEYLVAQNLQYHLNNDDIYSALSTDEKKQKFYSDLQNEGFNFTEIKAVQKAFRMTTSSAGNAVLPLDTDFRITGVYGENRGDHYHSGIDLAAPGGSAVEAAKDGKVVFVGYSGGYGNRVVIDHGNGMQTTYNHLSSYGVSIGDKVTAGEQIAEVGSTGHSTGNHLHFEVKIDGSYVNPESYFDFGNGMQVTPTNSYAAINSGGGRSGGSKKGSGKSSTKNAGSVQTAKYNTITNVAKSSPGSSGVVTSGSSGKTSNISSGESSNYAYLPTASSKTGATLPTAKGSTSTIKYNQKGTSTTATSKTSRPTYWYDSILS